jgi:hypothetical protein
MRYLVLTDIHANLEALEACLADAQPRRYDQTLVLGDLVGYGGDPRASNWSRSSTDRHREPRQGGGLTGRRVHAVASAAKWTLEVLKPDHHWLCALPEGRSTSTRSSDLPWLAVDEDVTSSTRPTRSGRQTTRTVSSLIRHTTTPSPSSCPPMGSIAGVGVRADDAGR